MLGPVREILAGGEGIENQIVQGRKAGRAGVLGILAAVALQAVAAVARTAGGNVSDTWPLVASAVIVSVSVALLAFRRVWIRESREPFRYTYWIRDFEPIESAGKVRLDWLVQDLSNKLSRGFTRLSIAKPPDNGGERQSHIDIGGSFGLRDDRDKGLVVEVIPQVRVAGPGAAVARPARVAVGDALREGNAPSGGAVTADEALELDPEQYAALVEHVYFDVASEIYKQIRRDVERKIAMLPTRRLRAAAYLHEARDYATSNTLDAFKEAQTLYEHALVLYDPRERPRASARWRRFVAWIARGASAVVRRARRALAHVWARAGRAEILLASAEIGSAMTLLSRRELAALSGTRLIPPFRATDWAERALGDLERLPSDVPGRDAALFDAYVASAFAARDRDDFRRARACLEKARQINPMRADDDPRYLLVAGLSSRRVLDALRRLRRAVEVAPDLEIAQWNLAKRLENLWRARESLESDLARMAEAEYENAVRLNPGNIGAWGSLGYIRWLLAGVDSRPPDEREPGQPPPPLDAELEREARRALVTGLDHKDVRRDAFVAQLDYALARLDAETGDFAPAYEHYINAVSARLAEYGPAYGEYFFEQAGDAMLERFRLYRERVELRAGEDRRRIVSSVRAFVEDDYGHACLVYASRTGDLAARQEAWQAFEKASELNPNFVLPYFHRAHVCYLRWKDLPPDDPDISELVMACKRLNQALRLEPEWAEAKLFLVKLNAELADRKEKQDEVAPVIVDLRGERHDELREKACETLVELLPHTELNDGDKTLLNDRGDAVDLLLRRRIRWREKFDYLHVDSLIAWAGLLASWRSEDVLGRSLRLCSHLEEQFYPTNYELLQTRTRALDRLGGPVAELEGIERVLRTMVEDDLEADPGLFPALQLVYKLPRAKRAELFERALETRGTTPGTRLNLLALDRERGADRDLSDELVEAAYGSLVERWQKRGSPTALGTRAALDFAIFLEERDRRPEALDMYTRAVEGRDENGQAAAAAAARLGDLLGEGDPSDDDLEAAAAAYDTAAECGGAIVAGEARLHQGHVLERLDREPEAERAYAASIEAVPGACIPSVIALVRLMRARSANPAEVRGAIGRGTAGHGRVAMRLGERFAEDGDLEAAEFAYRAVAADDEMRGGACYALGTLLEHRGRKAAAQEAYRQAAEMPPKEFAGRAGVALARLEEDPDEAKTLIDKAVESGDPEAVEEAERLRDDLPGFSRNFVPHAIKQRGAEIAHAVFGGNGTEDTGGKSAAEDAGEDEAGGDRPAAKP